MDNFSYTISPFLKTQLNTIDETRARILLALIPSNNEIKFRWEALVNRIAFSMRLQTVHLKKRQIAHVLTPSPKKKLSWEETLASDYKKVHDYIVREWYINEAEVTAKTIKTLLALYSSEKMILDETKLNNALHFIQVNPEHPVIQAGLAQMILLSLLPDTPNADQLGRFLAQLFLYKRGYDFRGMLVIEDYFLQNQASYKETLYNNRVSPNISGFLDYYTLVIDSQTKAILSKIADTRADQSIPEVYFTLTERQKKILALFDEPGIRVTNRDVQKLFDVSQITSSRDLSKIASLGLVFPNGKGRSVYYTKL